MLLNDDSGQNLNHMQRLLWLPAWTVAKKMLAVRWQPLHSLSMLKRTFSLKELLCLELSVAKMNGAGLRVLNARKEALEVARAMI